MEHPSLSGDRWLREAMAERRSLHERHDALVDRFLLLYDEGRDPANFWKSGPDAAEEANELARRMQALAARVLAVEDQIYARIRDYGLDARPQGTEAA